MTEVKELALTVTALAVALSTVLGAIGWLILPRVREWLWSEIADPVQATHEQMTNTHTTNLRDDVDQINREITTLREEVGQVAASVTSSNLVQDEMVKQLSSLQTNQSALVVVLDDHLEWSKEWTARHEGEST